MAEVVDLGRRGELGAVGKLGPFGDDDDAVVLARRAAPLQDIDAGACMSIGTSGTRM